MNNSFLKNTVYALLDLVTLKKGVTRKINNMSIRFPAKWSRYYESNYEADNYTFLREFVRPGMHIIDIGAHLGLFSVTSSKLTGKEGKVICFEPTPKTFAVLKETLRLNHCENVTALQAAVSDKVGTATFYVSNESEGCNSNSLVKTSSEKEVKAYEVNLVTIDSITGGYSLNPSLIKIDAEGAELDVLKGGINTFRTAKPVLILGLHPEFIKQKGDSPEAIWDMLTGIGYEIKLNGVKMTRTLFCQNELLFDVACVMA